jgi:hypothetical protein
MLFAGEILDYTREAAVFKSNVYSITLYESTGRKSKRKRVTAITKTMHSCSIERQNPRAARESHVPL